MYINTETPYEPMSETAAPSIAKCPRPTHDINRACICLMILKYMRSVLSGPDKEMLLPEAPFQGPRATPGEEGVPDPKGNTGKKPLSKASSWNLGLLHPQRGPATKTGREVLPTESLFGANRP